MLGCQAGFLCRIEIILPITQCNLYYHNCFQLVDFFSQQNHQLELTPITWSVFHVMVQIYIKKINHKQAVFQLHLSAVLGKFTFIMNLFKVQFTNFKMD